MKAKGHSLVFLLLMLLVFSGGPQTLPAVRLILKIPKAEKATSVRATITSRQRLGAQELSPGPDSADLSYAPRQVLAKFKSKTSRAAIREIVSSISGRVIRRIPQLNVYVIKTGLKTSPVDLAKRLEANPAIEYAEPNFVIKLAATIPNDPYFSTAGSWGQPYDDLWWLKKVKAPEAWDIEKGDPDVVVAVPDSGLDFTHEDMQQNVWTNPGETGGGKETNGVDDDANGFVDDWRGWDFANNDNDPTDDHGHGTGIAGVIASTADNGVGIAGISWRNKVMVVKGFGPAGTAYNATTAESVLYAADNGARAINMSSSMGDMNVIKDAVDYAFNKGAVIVSGGGASNGAPIVPGVGAWDNVLTTGWTNYLDEKDPGSNYGPEMELSAPGADILTIHPPGLYGGGGPDRVVGNYYYRANGGSYASPMGAAVAGLLFSQNPSWTNKQVMAQIIGTTDDIGVPGLGTGRINAYAALTGTPRTYIRYLRRRIIDAAGNNDGKIDIGEAVDMPITIRNLTNPVTGVSATLSTTDPYVSIATATVDYGDMDTWDLKENSTTPFTVAFSAQTPRFHRVVFSLNITANGGSYSSTDTFEERLASFLPGWPAIAFSFSHPALADLDNDGVLEGLLGANDIAAFNGDAGSLPGWPQPVAFNYASSDPNSIPERASPAAGDLDNDGSLEVVAAGDDKVYAWYSDGSLLPGFPLSTGDASSSLKHATLADLDLDGTLEIISSDHKQGKVYAWRYDGTSVAGWPVNKAATGQFPRQQTQAVGEIDGDGYPEVVVGAMDNKVYAFNHDGSPVAGWPVSLGGAGLAPVLADIDWDGTDEVFVGSEDRMLNGLKGDGSSLPGWPQPGGMAAVGDIDGDLLPEIVTPQFGQSLSLHAYKVDGIELPGWPVRANSYMRWAPSLGDLDGDGRADVLMRDNSSMMMAWKADGSPVSDFPMFIPDSISVPQVSSVAIGDIDGDGLVDLLTGARRATNDYLAFAFGLPSAVTPGGNPWPMYQHDSQHSGRYVAGPAPDVSTTVSTTPTTPNGQNGWFDTTPTITLKTNRAASSYYQWDSTSTGSWTTFSTGFSAPPNQHMLYYYSVDTSGSREATQSFGPLKVDTGAPSSPVLTASPVGSTEISLAWTPAIDSASGVERYVIFDAATDTTVATTTATTKSFSGLTPGITYQYYVKAVDVAGNVSAASNTAAVTLPAGGDTAPPGKPAVIGFLDSSTSIDLFWQPTTDNMDVAGYEVYNAGDDSLVGMTTATKYRITGLTPATDYSYYAKAFDSAGNHSSASNIIALKTGFSGSTAAGAGEASITVCPDAGVSVTFSDVTGDGATVVDWQANPLVGSPSGFTLIGRQFDLTTSASFVPPITIAVRYDESLVSGSEGSLKLFHRENGAWKDVTEYVDTTNNIIVGRVNSFSLFMLGSPVASTGLNNYFLAVIAIAMILGGAKAVGLTRSSARTAA